VSPQGVRARLVPHRHRRDPAPVLWAERSEAEDEGSLLRAEGRSVFYVARQPGHGDAPTLGTYGQVIDELDGAEKLDAEAGSSGAKSG
jgi:hypothetical protein